MNPDKHKPCYCQKNSSNPDPFSFPGEIRCYCDAPHCVATGYMCKSELNACFTKVLDPLNVNSPLTHGCLDPIVNSADICSSSSRAVDILSGASTLECCHDDMCNYRGLHDLAHTRDSTGKRRNPRTAQSLSVRMFAFSMKFS